MKAAGTTLHRQFSLSVRFVDLRFPVLDCGLILDHSDMPFGRYRAHVPLGLVRELFELAFVSPSPKRATR
jgi:hypothetical protein